MRLSEVVLGVERGNAMPVLMSIVRNSRILNPQFARRAYRSNDMSIHIQQYRLLKKKLKQKVQLKKNNCTNSQYQDNQLLELEYRINPNKHEANRSLQHTQGHSFHSNNDNKTQKLSRLQRQKLIFNKVAPTSISNIVTKNKLKIKNVHKQQPQENAIVRNRMRNMTMQNEDSQHSLQNGEFIRKRMHTVGRYQDIIADQKNAKNDFIKINPIIEKNQTNILMQKRQKREKQRIKFQIKNNKQIKKHSIKSQQVQVKLQKVKLLKCLRHLHSILFEKNDFDPSRCITQSLIAQYLAKAFNMHCNTLFCPLQKDQMSEKESFVNLQSNNRLQLKELQCEDIKIIDTLRLVYSEADSEAIENKNHSYQNLNYPSILHQQANRKIQLDLKLSNNLQQHSNSKYHCSLIKNNIASQQILMKKERNKVGESETAQKLNVYKIKNDSVNENITKSVVNVTYTNKFIKIPYSIFTDESSSLNSINKIANMPLRDALELCFQLYDKDGDGVIGEKDLLQLFYLSASRMQLTADVILLARCMKKINDRQKSLSPQHNTNYSPKNYNKKSNISHQSEFNSLSNPQSKDAASSKMSPRRFFFMKRNLPPKNNGIDIRVFKDLFKTLPAGFYEIIRLLFGIKKGEYYYKSTCTIISNPIDKSLSSLKKNSFQKSSKIIQKSQFHQQKISIKSIIPNQNKSSNVTKIQQESFQQLWQKRNIAAKKYLSIAKRDII